MLWQFFSLPGIENGIEYRYFSRYRIEVRNSSIVTTLIYIYIYTHTYSPLHKYWNSKDTIAQLAVESRHLQIWLKDEYETKLQNVTFYY